MTKKDTCPGLKEKPRYRPKEATELNLRGYNTPQAIMRHAAASDSCVCLRRVDHTSIYDNDIQAYRSHGIL